jgi:hypothetical protein
MSAFKADYEQETNSVVPVFLKSSHPIILSQHCHLMDDMLIVLYNDHIQAEVVVSAGDAVEASKNVKV